MFCQIRKHKWYSSTRCLYVSWLFGVSIFLMLLSKFIPAYFDTKALKVHIGVWIWLFEFKNSDIDQALIYFTNEMNYKSLPCEMWFPISLYTCLECVWEM